MSNDYTDYLHKKIVLAPTQEPRFKDGDLIKCVKKRNCNNPKTDSRVTVGKVYTVHKAMPDSITIENDVGKVTRYAAKYFEEAIKPEIYDFLDALRRL